MAKFTLEEVATFTAIQQLINDWVFDLDFRDGLNIGELITEDCSYATGGWAGHGRKAIAEFYRQRFEKLSKDSNAVPAMRHLNANLRVIFKGPDEASITFGLLFFTAEGNPAGANHTDAAAVADVWMDCRRESDGHWRISRFESEQPFSRSFPESR